MFGNDRKQLRQMFFDVWRKHNEKSELEALEQLICQIILMHPEYHQLLDDAEVNLERDYFAEQGDVNPFLHMAMHISIHEQLATQRPEGISAVYALLLAKESDPHQSEHIMMDCLSEMIWQSQKSGQPPDDQTYINCLNKAAQN
jgi:hypothetical protein